jgi:putative ABC transport system permease protein
MTAVLLKAVRDLRRRRLQAAVVLVTALLAAATGTMAVTLISQTRDPYQTAFEEQRGSHLQVVFDGRVVDPSTVSGTAATIGASPSGGPYPTTQLQIQVGIHKFSISTIGRDSPGGRVDQLRVTAGHWPRTDGEIAVTRSFAELNHLSVGDSVRVVSVPREPVLTVAAEVADVDQGSADVRGQSSWVLSSAVVPLSSRGSTDYLMDYRFASDPTSSLLQADVNALRGSLPAGGIASSTNYLAVRTLYDITNQIAGALILAFSVVALLATAAIVASLVTGIVISAYREIGIMKALGFTPLQVELVFVLQIVIPVAAGNLVGVPLGAVASQPLLGASWQALQLTYQPSYSAAPGVAVLLGSLLVVAVAAFLPALRAGRLRAAVVIASAGSPRGRSGRWLRRLGARLRLPRAVVVGTGDAFARPARAVLTLFTIFLGVATVTLALGVPRSFGTIISASGNGLDTDVVVQRSPALPGSDAARIVNTAGPVDRVVGELTQTVAVPGIGDPVTARFFSGDPSRIGFLLYSGRWYRGAGEAVAPRALLQDAHLKVGDRVTVTAGNRPIGLLLVGESLDANSGGHSLFLDLSTLAAVQPDASPDTYLVSLRPGSDVGAYVRSVAAAQPDLLDVHRADVDALSVIQTISYVLLALAAMMVLIAGAGIVNTLLLNARERTRDTATLRAIGMSPRQVMVMIAASAAPLAIIAGALAVPAGIGLDRLFLTILGTAAGGNDIPPAVYQVYPVWELLLIPLAGIAMAVAAALIPGRWAARANLVAALHAE